MIDSVESYHHEHCIDFCCIYFFQEVTAEIVTVNAITDIAEATTVTEVTTATGATAEIEARRTVDVAVIDLAETVVDPVKTVEDHAEVENDLEEAIVEAVAAEPLLLAEDEVITSRATISERRRTETKSRKMDELN
jgi:hypothetical protein